MQSKRTPVRNHDTALAVTAPGVLITPLCRQKASDGLSKHMPRQVKHRPHPSNTSRTARLGLPTKTLHLRHVATFLHHNLIDKVYDDYWLLCLLSAIRLSHTSAFNKQSSTVLSDRLQRVRSWKLSTVTTLVFVNSFLRQRRFNVTKVPFANVLFYFIATSMPADWGYIQDGGWFMI